MLAGMDTKGWSRTQSHGRVWQLTRSSLFGSVCELRSLCPEDWSAQRSPSCDRIVASLQVYRSPLPFGMFSLHSDSEENIECVPWAL